MFWEVDPATLGGADRLSDPEFEKEAWLSTVLLQWGCCGQVATETTPTVLPGGPLSPCLGYILYAPPGEVPRAWRFPTAPVSADAVLLTSLGVEPTPSADGLAEELVGRAITELTRRGVRAVEAFGRTPAVSDLAGPGAAVGERYPELAGVFEATGDCSVEHCIIDAELLTDFGFSVVAPHPYFPRLRLELDRDLGWKAEVEAALDRLLENARLPQRGAAPAALVGVSTAADGGVAGACG